MVSNEFAGGLLGGNVDFNKTVVDIREFRSRGNLFTLALHFRAGYAFPFAEVVRALEDG
jgi:hypothetical protein